MISERRIAWDREINDLFSITDVKILENFLLELSALVKNYHKTSYFDAVIAYFIVKRINKHHKSFIISFFNLLISSFIFLYQIAY